MLSNELLTSVAALACVLSLVVGTGRLLRTGKLARLPGLGASRQGVLAVKASLAIDQRRRMLLVRCDGRDAIILTGPNGDLFLGWRHDPGGRPPPGPGEES